MKNSATRDAFFAIFAVIAALAPFLNKAFHIDDPLFLWMAQQVSQHPGDPYGFSLNWYGIAQPMFSVMQNPPLGSYYMALAATFLGWSELAMHGAFLVPAVAATLGTFFLARRLCDSPLLAALLTLFTPVFLVSATGVMCDVWLLALWVWSVESWLHGLERHSYRFFFLASVLAAAAALTKYFGASLVPLLAAYTLVRDRRFTYRLLFLLIPVTVIIMYEVMTKAKYGEGLFSNAMIYSWKERTSAEKHLFAQFIIGLSFTGGCAQRRAANSVLLSLWVIGTFFFAAIMNWSITSRTLLPMAPAVMILLLRRFNASGASNGRTLWWPLLPAALVSLLVTTADYKFANTARLASSYFQNRFQTEPGTVWFEGHWGFQYYVEQWRAKPVDLEQWTAKPVNQSEPGIVSGDLVIIPVNNTNISLTLPATTGRREQVNFPQFLLATMSPKTAGFYSSIWGPLPWSFARIPPERYLVFRVK